VLRPGWLNVRRALEPLVLVAVIVAIDRAFGIDSRFILAVIPVLWLGLLAFHIRKYRIWCEDNYSSMDYIDVQWIWRYITMYLISGVSYICMSFSYTPSHAFTQQWLLLFMLAYSTEQILFRQDPWVIIRRAKKTMQPEPEEPEDDNTAPQLTNAEYRVMLEEWINKEKPYLNPEFRLLDLRQVLPLNRTYLSQLINTEYSCSFYQWVSRLRIEEAKRLKTEHPDMTMEEVAEQCGFSSARSFYRTFAREEDMTPTEWLATQSQ
jgi:AraC-like DNA-binding protein